MREPTSRILTTCGLLTVICLVGNLPIEATPTIMIEPYKEYADGTTEPLSTRANRPTVFLWGEGETIRWWAWSDIAENNIPSSKWHVRDSEGVVSDYPAVWGWTRWYCSPEDTLDKGDYEFWVTATDDDGTVASDTYYIRMTFPPIVETRYHSTATEFLGKLARNERTAFNFGAYGNGVLDTPEVKGCDNPSMFWGNGMLHVIFGDPNVNTGDPESPTRGLSGALAFTDQIVPAKGIDLAHRRNWVTDPATGTAKEIITRRPGISRVNNTSGAILPRGEGHRIWFAYYDYGSGPRESYRNYYRVGIAYSDNYFETPAVRDDSLILWDKDDAENGAFNPDPYLGYHMRRFKDHLYMMIPREGGSSPVLLRCHVNDLDNISLDDWHWLVSVDGDGAATWSVEGVSRSQISHDDFPIMDFGENTGIVNTVVWSPYLNRWIAVSATGMRMWEARYLWGPYVRIQIPRYFKVAQFAQSYAFFGHELMLGNNGEWIYHARARSWQPKGLYGTYNQRLHMRDKLRMTVSPKSGIAGDTITVTCVNDSDMPSPPPENVSVTVDGMTATFQSQNGDTFTFTYTLDGTENGGAVGIVEVAGVMEIPMDDETSFRMPRDAILVVNHRNELNVAIQSPSSGATVSGWLPIDVDATYGAAPEALEPQQPEVRILKTELRHLNGEEEVVTTDVEPPYTLWLNTTRYSNGTQQFKVVAYDTLDRRGEASITLNVQNPPETVARNLVADGDMESLGVEAWQPIYGAVLSKISDETHRGGHRSLLLHSDAPGSWAGFRQTVTGLQGGERLRFTAWGRLKNNYTAQLRWNIDDQWGGTVSTQYVSSYGYFRRMTFEFDNPPGNTELLLECIIRDTGDEGSVAGEGVTVVDAILDDIALRPACHPVVEPPANVTTEIDPGGHAVTVDWEGSTDVGIEYYDIYRKPVSGETWAKIGTNRVYDTIFTDGDLPGPAEEYEYKVVAVDAMGWDSDTGNPEPLGEVSSVLDGAPPLQLVDRSSTSLVVEEVPGATAYNVYADTIGSWYSPTAEEGSVCGITGWTDNPDGTVTLTYDVPENSWIVVTASNECHEGPTGSRSDGTQRSEIGAWAMCGALP
jgi:hypothetical protein